MFGPFKTNFACQKQDSVYTFVSYRRDKDNNVMTLVNISICVTCVDLGVYMLSIIDDMAVCVHRSAIKRLHYRCVRCDVVILNMLHSERCSWWLICNILTMKRHITTKFGDNMLIYMVFMFANYCSFFSETNNCIEIIVWKHV
jgi:hypothetical protein